jgi:hypothetical protein
MLPDFNDLPRARADKQSTCAVTHIKASGSWAGTALLQHRRDLSKNKVREGQSAML